MACSFIRYIPTCSFKDETARIGTQFPIFKTCLLSGLISWPKCTDNDFEETFWVKVPNDFQHLFWPLLKMPILFLLAFDIADFVNT